MRGQLYDLIACAAIAVRSLVALWGFSGYNSPPMHGDFEAHRHWMEITTNIPIGDWYRNTRDNDLLYWGLDYPPLMAYFSWLCGQVARVAYPQLVELFESRGLESAEAKSFMRRTVLIGDCVLLVPAVYYLFSLKSKRGHDNSVGVALLKLLCLMTPCLILIDHGHFQYNGMCIAFALIGAGLVVQERDVLGSVFFCFSLNTKQMALYYAPVFFFALLRKCYQQPAWSAKFSKLAVIGLTVLATFAVLWVPFCLWPSAEETCLSSLGHVLSRQFPFSRGIFEDKVANIWYALSVVVDYRHFIALPQLVSLSLVLTLTLLGPVCYLLISYPLSLSHILLGLVNSSLAFFLASFQVHEKSLLLTLVPASFLAEGDADLCTWLQMLGAFAMYPLLKRDGLSVPYLALCIAYCALSAEFRQASRRVAVDSSIVLAPWQDKPMQFVHSVLRVFQAVSYIGMVLLSIGEVFLPPPPRYPDLYPALFALFGAANLCAMYVLGVAWQYKAALCAVPDAGRKSKTS
ncbi:hypothetical protein EON64_09755 [archaeon]|nr:MAG: hypothetical protein EON64_09755 [archaeon]